MYNNPLNTISTFLLQKRKNLDFILHLQMLHYIVQQYMHMMHGRTSRHTKSNKSTKAIPRQRCNKMCYIKLGLRVYVHSRVTACCVRGSDVSLSFSNLGS